LNGIFFALQYSLARMNNMQPIDFFALLLHGIIFETPVIKLFVSHKAKTGFLI